MIQEGTPVIESTRRICASCEGRRLVHSIAGYLCFAISQYPNMQHNVGALLRGEELNGLASEAAALAQLWKSFTNEEREEYCKLAESNDVHPGSLEGGGSGKFRNPNPFEVQALLKALDDGDEEWCTD